MILVLSRSIGAVSIPVIPPVTAAQITSSVWLRLTSVVLLLLLLKWQTDWPKGRNNGDHRKNDKRSQNLGKGQRKDMRSLKEGNYKIIGEWTQSYEYAQKMDLKKKHWQPLLESSIKPSQNWKHFLFNILCSVNNTWRRNRTAVTIAKLNSTTPINPTHRPPSSSGSIP